MNGLLGRVSISGKILSLLALLGIVTIAISGVGFTTLRSTADDYSVLVDNKLPVTTRYARLNRLAVEMGYHGYRTLVYHGGTTAGRKSLENIETAYKTAQGVLGEVVRLDPSSADEVSTLGAQIGEIHATAAKGGALGFADREAEAQTVLADADVKIDSFGLQIQQLNKQRYDNARALAASLKQNSDTTAWNLLITSVGALVVGLGTAFAVSRAGITRPIATLGAAMRDLAAGNNSIAIVGVERTDEVGEMAKTVLVFRDAAIAQEAAQAAKAQAEADQRLVVEVLEKGLAQLATGDLTAEIRAEFSPSYETVKSNFNDAVAGLRELIGSVIQSTAVIRTGATEIAVASEDLARRTEANAASLEETSAAITQMDRRLKDTAEAAGRTVDRADGAISTVSSGRVTVDGAVAAMTRVAESAKGIDSVIEGLDKIAFQTRVLAMNAAVEAGRAGEAGRGFAVVADLVSALAMRAEEEAGRARDQLTGTQSDIVVAVDMVQKVDSALLRISDDVTEVHQLLEHIAKDNQAQSSAITQVSSAVAAMDTSTQQNAAMVEEASAAARNLNAEVNALGEQTARFSISSGRSKPELYSAQNLRPFSFSSAVQTPKRAALANGRG